MSSYASVTTMPTREALFNEIQPLHLLRVPSDRRHSLNHYAKYLTEVFNITTVNSCEQIVQMLRSDFLSPSLSEQVRELPQVIRPLILMNGIVTANVVSQSELRVAQEFFYVNITLVSSCLVPSSKDFAMVASHLYTQADFGALQCTWWETQKLQVLLELSVQGNVDTSAVCPACPLIWERSHSNMWRLVLSPSFARPRTLQVLNLYHAPQAIQVRKCVLQGNGFYHPDPATTDHRAAQYHCLPDPENNDCQHGIVYMAKPHNHWVLEVRRANGNVYCWTHPTAPAHQLWAGAWHFVSAWSDHDPEQDHEALTTPCDVKLVPFRAFYESKWEAKAWLELCLSQEPKETQIVYNCENVLQVLRRYFNKHVTTKAPFLSHAALPHNPWVSLEGMKRLFAEIMAPGQALFLWPEGYAFALSEASMIDLGDRLFHVIDNIPGEHRKKASTLTNYCAQHLGHVLQIKKLERFHEYKASHTTSIYDLYHLLRDPRIVARSTDPNQYEGLQPLCWASQGAHGHRDCISSNPAYMNKHKRQQVERFLAPRLERIGINHRRSISGLAAYCARHFGKSATSALLLPAPSKDLQALFDNEKRLEWVLKWFLVASPTDSEPLQAFAWENDRRGVYISPNRHHFTLDPRAIEVIGRLLVQESRQTGQDSWSSVTAMLAEESFAWFYCCARLPNAMPKAYENVLTKWLVTDSPRETPGCPLWLDAQGSRLQINPYFGDGGLLPAPLEVEELRHLFATTALHQIPRDRRREVGLLLQVCGSPKLRQRWHATDSNAARVQALIRDHLIASRPTGDENYPLVWSQGVLVSNHLPERTIQVVQREAHRVFVQAPMYARETLSSFAQCYLETRGLVDGIEVPLLESILYDHLVAYSAAYLPYYPLCQIGKILVINSAYDLF